MARLKPVIYKSFLDKATGDELIIARGEGMYFITYMGEPISIITKNSYTNMPPKYIRVAWVNPGHAHNKAERLNKKFNTNSFEVHQMLTSEVVIENYDSSKDEDDFEKEDINGNS